MRFHFIVKDRSFYRRVLQIAIPIALQSLITIGVNMMDTIMLGSMGETQLSASSLANQFVHVYQIFCMGLGMGASVLIARFWGMQDKENLRKSITIMLRLTLILSALFTLATLVAPRSIMRIYTPDEGIISPADRVFSGQPGARRGGYAGYLPFHRLRPFGGRDLPAGAPLLPPPYGGRLETGGKLPPGTVPPSGRRTGRAGNAGGIRHRKICTVPLPRSFSFYDL